MTDLILVTYCCRWTGYPLSAGGLTTCAVDTRVSRSGGKSNQGPTLGWP